MPLSPNQPTNQPSRKAPCPMDVHSWWKALSYQDATNLVVMCPFWAVPCPSSGSFVRTKEDSYRFETLEILDLSHFSRHGIRVHKRLQNCLRILSNFSIPIPLYNENVLLWCLVDGYLELQFSTQFRIFPSSEQSRL